MKKILFSFLLLISSIAHSQIVSIPIPGAPGLNITVGTGVNALPLQNIHTDPAAVNITGGDDTYTNVPLQFNFPYFGKTFNNSWAMTNGMVTFQDPAVSGIGGACCTGINLTTTTDTRWNYSIFGLHTDLYPNGSSQYYLSKPTSMTYGWYNASQCCNSNGGNSFEIKIDSTGLVDTRIAGALVSMNPVTIGMSGDLSKGEYYQYYHGPGLTIIPGSSSIVSWQALNGTGTDLCTTDPLYSPSCPGYAEAYHNQQCSINPLYAVTCPGYQTAYFNLQCSLNPLYNPECPGYRTAYFNQQCSLDGLYSTSCPNYAEAYAKKKLLDSTSTSTTTATVSVQLNSDGKVSSDVPLVTDSNVNKVITSSATTAAPSATAPVQLIAPPGGINVDTKTETKSASAPQSTAASTTRKQTTQTTRTQKQAEAAAKESMKDSSEAKTLDAQIATQSNIVAAMGLVPGFSAYQNAIVPDTMGRELNRQYDKPVVDNARALRQLSGASDRLHQEMVNGQHRR